MVVFALSFYLYVFGQGNGYLSLIRQLSFYENIYNGNVSVISEITFAMVTQQRNWTEGAVFIVDLHWRDENGRTSVTDKILVLKFANSIYLISFILFYSILLKIQTSYINDIYIYIHIIYT